MTSDNLAPYADLWENSSRYLLVPLELTPYGLVKSYAEVGYVIYEKLPLGFAVVIVIEDVIKEVVKRMIQAGVEIRNQPLEDNLSLDQFWTDRINEFILIHWKDNLYKIYHKELKEYVILDLSSRKYQNLISKMIAGGVEIVDKSDLDKLV